MLGIYSYIPETNYAPRKYSIASILLLLFMVLIFLVSVVNLLYFYISTFRSMCAGSNMAVFCSSLISCFPGILLTHFLNDFEIVSVDANLLLLFLLLLLLTAIDLSLGDSRVTRWTGNGGKMTVVHEGGYNQR
jgi:hypothetical protein